MAELGHSPMRALARKMAFLLHSCCFWRDWEQVRGSNWGMGNDIVTLFILLCTTSVWHLVVSARHCILSCQSGKICKTHTNLLQDFPPKVLWERVSYLPAPTKPLVVGGWTASSVVVWVLLSWQMISPHISLMVSCFPIWSFQYTGGF